MPSFYFSITPIFPSFFIKLPYYLCIILFFFCVVFIFIFHHQNTITTPIAPTTQAHLPTHHLCTTCTPTFRSKIINHKEKKIHLFFHNLFGMHFLCVLLFIFYSINVCTLHHKNMMKMKPTNNDGLSLKTTCYSFSLVTNNK